MKTIKILVIIFVAFFSFLFVSCSNHKGTVRISQQEYDSLKYEVKYLKENLEYNEKYISNLKENPLFFLLVIDAELSAAEKGKEGNGSFSDFFVPTIHEALDAGVSRIEIQKRVNRLIKLANNGLFISSYEKELFKEGGTKKIIEYIGLNSR